MAYAGRKRHYATLPKLSSYRSIGINDRCGVFDAAQRATSRANLLVAKIILHFLSEGHEFSNDFRVFLHQIHGFTHVFVEIEFAQRVEHLTDAAIDFFDPVTDQPYSISYETLSQDRVENEQPRGADTEKFPILVLMQKSHGCLCITLSDSLLFGGSHAFQQLFILQQWQRWLVVSLESGWVSLGRSRLIFLRVRISRWQRRAEITPGALSLWPHVNRVRVYPEFDAIICRRRRSATSHSCGRLCETDTAPEFPSFVCDEKNHIVPGESLSAERLSYELSNSSRPQQTQSHIVDDGAFGLLLDQIGYLRNIFIGRV